MNPVPAPRWGVGASRMWRTCFCRDHVAGPAHGPDASTGMGQGVCTAWMVTAAQMWGEPRRKGARWRPVSGRPAGWGPASRGQEQRPPAPGEEGSRARFCRGLVLWEGEQRGLGMPEAGGLGSKRKATRRLWGGRREATLGSVVGRWRVAEASTEGAAPRLWGGHSPRGCAAC